MRRALTVVLVAVAAALAGPAVARADVVTQWNINAATALLATAGQPPGQSVPHLAMVHGAVYDAVNAIDGGHLPYLLSPSAAGPFDSKDAAAATAAYRVLVTLLPAQQATLDAQYAASLATVPDGTPKTRGIAVGEAAAAAMLAARSGDGRFGAFRFTVGSEPGAWKPVLPAFVNDPNAWLKDLKPFLVDRPSRFRSAGPLRMTSLAYARELDEVRVLGSASSTHRSADQTNAARYWAENPPATWSRVLRTLSAQNGLSVVENARLFAMAYMTAADALISVWDDKAHYSFWRPITAIREADTDGNPLTWKDENWTPLLATPPYPDHPSGLAGLSSAITATVQDFFGTDMISWRDTNNAGLTRNFTRLSQAVQEIVDARVWSGIHFRTADEQGARIGREVAQYRKAHAYFMKRRADAALTRQGGGGRSSPPPRSRSSAAGCETEEDAYLPAPRDRRGCPARGRSRDPRDGRHRVGRPHADAQGPDIAVRPGSLRRRQPRALRVYARPPERPESLLRRLCGRVASAVREGRARRRAWGQAGADRLGPAPQRPPAGDVRWVASVPLRARAAPCGPVPEHPHARRPLARAACVRQAGAVAG